MYQKGQLLAILASDVCPVCGSTKERYQWTCTPCYRPLKDSLEHHHLNDSCDEHMRYAREFLMLAKQTVRPESD